MGVDDRTPRSTVKQCLHTDTGDGNVRVFAIIATCRNAAGATYVKSACILQLLVTWPLVAEWHLFHTPHPQPAVPAAVDVFYTTQWKPLRRCHGPAAA